MQCIVPYRLRDHRDTHFETSRDVPTSLARRPVPRAGRQDPKWHVAGRSLPRLGRARSKNDQYGSGAPGGDMGLYRHEPLPVSLWVGTRLLRTRFLRLWPPKASSAWARILSVLRSILRSVL
jgi:hypothetical protein